MTLSNVVADNHNNNDAMDENEQEDPNAAIIEQVNHLDADLEPTIDLLEQMKCNFDKMNGEFLCFICS